jgi:hypothetical protein
LVIDNKNLGKNLGRTGGHMTAPTKTLALELLGGASGYLNWDDPHQRERILKRGLLLLGSGKNS